MGTIGTESAFEVSARARSLEAQGRSIVHLQLGEPDFDTPANIREAAAQGIGFYYSSGDAGDNVDAGTPHPEQASQPARALYSPCKVPSMSLLPTVMSRKAAAAPRA